MYKDLANGKKIKKPLDNRKRKNLLFYVCMVALPVLQYCLLFIYSKIQSILLAFQSYQSVAGSISVGFAGFKNFAEAFTIIKDNLFMLKNSLIMYAVDLIVGMGLALIFSYYISKNYKFSGAFKAFLFLPQIVSSVVFGMLYRYLASEVYLSVIGADLSTAQGLLMNPKTQFGAILFYNVWIGFGARVLITSSAMSGIDSSIIESANLDGCNSIQEFFHITIPLIFPTFATLIVIGLTGIFTDQRNIYTLLQEFSSTGSNFGYYLYLKTQQSDIVNTPTGVPTYSVISSLGLIFSVIVFTLVTVVKKLLDKYGPSVN